MSGLYKRLKKNTDHRTKENNMTKTASEMMSSKKYADKTKVTKKGKKTKADNNKQLELSESITCNGCQQMFIEQDAKILCCDRCETWYCTKCAKISEAGYQFLKQGSRRHLLVL